VSARPSAIARCARAAIATLAFLRRYTVTHAAAYDGGQLGAVLDRDNTASDVWADTAYRSAANLTLIERRGLRPQFQRKKPRGKPMPAALHREPARPRDR
jgi:transposase, IS5 family